MAFSDSDDDRACKIRGPASMRRILVWSTRCAEVPTKSIASGSDKAPATSTLWDHRLQPQKSTVASSPPHPVFAPHLRRQRGPYDESQRRLQVSLSPALESPKYRCQNNYAGPLLQIRDSHNSAQHRQRGEQANVLNRESLPLLR